MSNNKYAFFSVFITLLIVLSFIFSFYLKNEIIPFHYDIDTFVFYKVAHSIKNIDFPVPESIGVSPLYPMIVACFDLFLNSKYSLLVANIFLCIVFTFFLFKTINIFKGKTFSLFFIILTVLNPLFLKVFLSGFSEIAAYLFVVMGFYSFFKEKLNMSIFLFLLAAIVRVEYILFLPLIFIFLVKKVRFKKIFIYFISFILLSSLLSLIFMRSESNPFVNKYSFIVFQLREYLKSENKTEFLNKAYFISNEAYSREKIANFHKENKENMNNYIIKVPYYYLLNSLVVLRILVKNLWIYLIWIPLYILFRREKIKYFWMLLFISPLLFIMGVPLILDETRYFTYLIPICTFSFMELIPKKKIWIIAFFIVIVMSYFSFNDYFLFNVDFHKNINEIKTLKIKDENIMTDSSWIAYETSNTWFMPPPVAEKEFSDFTHYLNENKIKYIIFDPGWKSLGYSFYNNEFHKSIKESKEFQSVKTGRIYKYENKE